MRIFDVLIAAILLICLSPLLLLISLIIKLDSTGPVLFRQQRVGKNGREFTCLKFRTMVEETANLPTHQVPASNITPAGHILRRTKLDELPQLVNVLIGQMNLVGPRPCLLTQHDLIEARKKYQALDVNPGITGLAQINGVDMSTPKKLAAFDGYYAKKRSVCRDIEILCRTFTHIISKTR